MSTKSNNTRAGLEFKTAPCAQAVILKPHLENMLIIQYRIYGYKDWIYIYDRAHL